MNAMETATPQHVHRWVVAVVPGGVQDTWHTLGYSDALGMATSAVFCAGCDERPVWELPPKEELASRLRSGRRML